MRYEIELNTYLRRGELENWNKIAGTNLVKTSNKLTEAIYAGEGNLEIINKMAKMGAVKKITIYKYEKISETK